MDLLHKTIYFEENQKDIFSSLQSQGIDTAVISKRFKHLFNKIYNNEVGYYRFLDKGIIYHFVILPKIIDKNSPNRDKEFVNYLLQYYRVNNKYRFDKDKIVSKSLLALAFESIKNKSNSHELIEKFEFFKVQSILKQIEEFFKKHKSSKKRKVNYLSQSIRHKLNLQKNIKELDKTKIHQIKEVDENYSLIATITVLALRLYAKTKLNKQKNKALKKEVKKLYTMIEKKYIIDNRYSLNLATLFGRKTDKLFQKKYEHKILLSNIKSLFGYEHLYQDNFKQSVRYDNETDAFFIKPDTFYEWYVYDILKEYVSDNNLKILFDKSSNKPKQEYYLDTLKNSSNPDYVIIDENKKIKIVIDAKWKIVKGINEINKNDYLKLKFDSYLRKQDGYGIVSYLIYPSLSNINEELILTYNNNEIFKFFLMQIDMDFDKYQKNGIYFSYSIENISSKIEKNLQKQKIIEFANNVSKEIGNSRDENIRKLIYSTTEDEKESIGGLFDEKLIEASQNLSQEIDKEIILPEVENLLNNFDEILEDDSKTFLRSSSTLYAYYKDLDSVDFDYSMPGSGLWKLVELELNTSFIWYIRILQNVCNKNDPWVKICRPNARIFQVLDNGEKVALTIPDKNDNTKLQSVMFGGIKKLLNDNSTINDFENFWREYPLHKDFIKNVLFNIIEQIIIFRNEHAHIKAMEKDKFIELWELLFNDNNLSKILNFKNDLVNNIRNT